MFPVIVNRIFYVALHISINIVINYFVEIKN